MKLRTLPLLLACTIPLTALGATGCVVREQPVEYAEADPGVDVTVYPHDYYEGRTVYWVHDRWYYRDGNHWRYYRSEPGELYRRRHVVREERREDRREDRHEDRHEDRDDHRR